MRLDEFTPITTSERTGSKMPPRKFQFVEVLPLEGSAPGGWQIACIKALIGQGLPNAPYATSRVCDIQVGVPYRTQIQGLITTRNAQYASAKAANEAAYRVLERSVGVDARTCQHIRGEMERLLNKEIASARVTKCRAVGVGVVTSRRRRNTGRIRTDSVQESPLRRAASRC